MELRRRNAVIFGVLAAIWVLVVAWQIEEHYRVKSVAKAGLYNRSRDIADTLSAFIRGSQFRGGVIPERLEPVLNEMVNGRTNELVKSSEVLWIALLNATGEPLASAGTPTIDPQKTTVPEGGLWGDGIMTMLYAVEGATITPEGGTNQIPTIVAPSFHDITNANPDAFRGRGWRGDMPPGGPGSDGPHPPEPRPDTTVSNFPPPGTMRDNPMRDMRPPRRPFWARNLDEEAYQRLIKRRELHGLVLAMSTHNLGAISFYDLWLRSIILFFATISATGAALAWRNIAKTSELQLRLVRASELNIHLKEMNLAAAGLAHETRNPLNIVRGLAQMISKQPEASKEIREKARGIVDETDKVTAQLNEFINYSRPRELRRTAIALNSAINEVVRALSYDIEEKKIKVEVKADPLTIEADEQSLRQVLFNLLLNAVQAVGTEGQIAVSARRANGSEVMVEVQDNGPGVPEDRRTEIFKPYFTTQQKGTGLGLAIVQQIVLAHGWEVECLSNEPKGAIFRITHLKLAARH